MKRKLLLVFILTSLSVSSYAQGFWKKVGNFLGQVATGVVIGVVDQMAEHSGDQKTIDNWNQIKESSNLPSYTYSYDAGQQLTQGNWVGAAISAASGIAEEAGVNPDLVALGNSGLTNFVNGNNNAAMIDVVQLGAHATGNYQFDYFLNTQKDINQINREYRNNIRNGMSKEEADRIRIERISNTTADMIVYIEGISADRKARANARKNEVKNALLQRGYSPMEAEYLSAYMSIETLNEMDDPWASVDEMLDNHHIGPKVPVDGNVFFDDENVIVPPTNTDDENPPAEEEQPIQNQEPQPVTPEDPLRDVKDNLERITLSGYGLNGIELLESQKIELDEAAELLKQHTSLQICLTGNSCDIGSDYGKERVAMQRAKNAKAYLVGKGIDSDRIEVASKADTESLNSNASESERKQNRRVYISIIE